MKKIFFLLLSFAALPGWAATYFFSSTAAGTGTGTQAAPFTRLSILDSLLQGKWAGLTAHPGDNFSLKRGDVFFISKPIQPSIAGIAGAPITINAYGVGPDPRVVSWKRVTGWQSVTGRPNVYTSAAVGSLTKYVPLLRADGVFKEVGRYPNASAANHGFKQYTATNTVDTIWDKNWNTYADRPKNADGSFATNFYPGELAVRPNHYRINKVALTAGNHPISSTGIIFDVGGDLLFDKNNGYFLQNHISLLDIQDEWSYDKTTDQVSIYSTTSPSSRVIEVPVSDKLIYLTGEDYYLISGVVFDGCAHTAIMGDNSTSNVTVAGCQFLYNGYCGINARSGSGWTIDGNFFDMNLTYGLRVYTSNTEVKNNTLYRTMPVPAMNYFGGSGMGAAIDQETGDNFGCHWNKISRAGYSAILFNRASNVDISYNLCDSSTYIIDDGGVIYTVNLVYETNRKNKQVHHNILLHNANPTSQYGILNNSSPLQMALYGDEWTMDQSWHDNIVADGRTACYANDAVRDTFINNIFFNFSFRGFQLSNQHRVGTKIGGKGGVTETTGETAPAMNGNYASGNVYYSAASPSGSSPYEAPAAEYFTKTTVYPAVDYPKNYGTFENQIFVYPFAQANTEYFRTDNPQQGGPGGNVYNEKKRSWDDWNALLSYDNAHTFWRGTLPSGATKDNAGILVYNDRKADSTISLGSNTYTDAKTGATRSGSITLAPFTGAVLILKTIGTVSPKPPTPPQTPVINGQLKSRFRRFKG